MGQGKIARTLFSLSLSYSFANRRHKIRGRVILLICPMTAEQWYEHQRFNDWDDDSEIKRNVRARLLVLDIRGSSGGAHSHLQHRLLVMNRQTNPQMGQGNLCNSGTKLEAAAAIEDMHAFLRFDAMASSLVISACGIDKIVRTDFRISRFWCFIFILRDSLPVELWRSCPVQPGAVGRAGGANFREDSASCWQIHPTFSSLGGEAASMTKRRSEKSLCRSFPGQKHPTGAWSPVAGYGTQEIDRVRWRERKRMKRERERE